MNTTPDIYEILYVSTMALTAPVSVVSSIATRSRVANVKRHITGLLIFDGERFCQQFEGSKSEVTALFERISCDTRHQNVILIHEGLLRERRFGNFSMAFANTDDFEALNRLQALKGTSALAAFSTLLQTLDMEARI